MINTSNAQYHRIQHGVRRLNEGSIGFQENGAEQTYFFDGIICLVHINSVPNIEGMLDEEEDDADEDLLQTAADEPAQRYIDI